MAYRPQVLAQSLGGTAQTNYSGNRVLISTKTASNSASLDITSGISGYDVYEIIFYDATLATNGAQLYVRISTDAGMSYLSTGYSSVLAYSVSTTASFTENTAGFNLGLSIANGTSTFPSTGRALLFGFNSSTYYKQIVSMGTNNHASGTIVFAQGGSNTATDPVDALQIIASSGNISTGTFKLFGIVN